MFGGNRNTTLTYVQGKIAALRDVESVSEAPDGALNVILSKGIDRRLREEVLNCGRHALVPVRVFYRMPDGRAIGERQIRAEAIEDYYTPLHVPGFAGEPSVAPPEEVAKEVDGAQKLSRIRSNTRGRPVIAWKMGEVDLRRGMEVVFKKPCCLQWTMGRTMNIDSGARGRIVDMATNRPLLYLAVGGYDSIELPVHLLGTMFDLIEHPKNENKKGSGPGIDAEIGYVTPGLQRLIGAPGLRVGWSDTGDGTADYPFNSANYSPLGFDRAEPYLPSASSDEDMLSSPETIDPSKADRRFSGKAGKDNTKQKKLVLGRK